MILKKELIIGAKKLKIHKEKQIRTTADHLTLC